MLGKGPDHFNMCVTFPTPVNSNGIWGYGPHEFGKITKSPMLAILLQIALIFGANSFFRVLLWPFGLPKLTHQIIAGTAIATFFSGKWSPKEQILFPLASQDIVGLISLLGYTLFFFLIAVKMDMSIVHKTGSKAMTIGLLSTLTPYVLGLIFQKAIAPITKSQSIDPNNEIEFILAVLSLTAFPVISSLLDDLNILNSELGRIGLSAGLVGDLFTSILLCFTSFLANFSSMHDNDTRILACLKLGGMVVFFLVIVFIIRPLMFRIVKHTPEGGHVSETSLHLVLVLVLGSGYVAYLLAQPVFFGPYILGLIVPDGPPLGSALVNKLEPLVNNFFMPLFVTSSAMRLDLLDLTRWKPKMTKASFLMTMDFLAKLVACVLPALYYRMPLKDSLILSLIICSRGIVELASYSFLRDSNMISDGIFAVLGTSVLIIATIQPMLIKYLYDPSKKYGGYTKRSIVDLKSNSNLRIMVCIHKVSDIPSMVAILEATCPTTEDPLVVDVLHLIELIGRATPTLISHQFQKKTATEGSCSEKLLVAFGLLERQYWEAVGVNFYSAFSPPTMMFEDICTLALDKIANLIVLPFHRKWYEDGTSIESEDNTMRQLNCSVLNRAPCSVGILIGRGNIKQPTKRDTPYSVCVIFLGGSDDREALAFARRMVKDSKMRLTIVRFAIPNERVEENDWDTRIDSNFLKDFRCNAVGDGYVAYIEEVVKDGPETALIVQPLVEEYDLVIVGRRFGIESVQTSGLEEWTEFPELGVLGDLLASKDLENKASLLVVQQQRTRAL